jgi:hypothetical protein
LIFVKMKPSLTFAYFRKPIVAAILSLVFGVDGFQAQQLSEYQVKAAYLYNFGKFVEWPSGAAGGSQVSICVLGQDPFGPALDAVLAGERIQGKSVVLRRIAKAQEAMECGILFISSSEDRRLSDVLSTVEHVAVLTVSDIPEFSRRGGMIQFVLEGKRVRFEVNLASAQNAGLTLSSELLKVAVMVRR